MFTSSDCIILNISPNSEFSPVQITMPFIKVIEINCKKIESIF